MVPELPLWKVLVPNKQAAITIQHRLPHNSYRTIATAQFIVYKNIYHFEISVDTDQLASEQLKRPADQDPHVCMD